ncbi:ATP-dependent DNA helicase DinG [Caldimonas tepidiphila]|uniref:ATP-dependent DNA helicase DinG n=1 Tax=Caldimonas tepidiphila TaxID=2315841 RepID=UPI00130045F5|nr:ATP-dependent DNA helicase DinG [Caldimonas tepidiphila]
MDKDKLHSFLDAQYEALAQRLPGFTPREGQRAMVREIADAIAGASFEPDGAPEARVAVIEAGTGVGKTRAYLLAGLKIARERKVKLLVSTATIALQEQLMNKDLPELSKALDEPFSFAMLKGRGRYACTVKLLQCADGEQGGLGLDEDDAQDGRGEAADGREMPASDLALFRKLAKRLECGDWDGQKDSLPDDAQRAFLMIAADRHSCTAKACDHYKRCPYYDAKRFAVTADVLVANHDLVLSSLKSDRSSIPSGERAVFVFDEGHHLPSIALAHGASEASLTSTAWVTRLQRALAVAAAGLGYPAAALPDGLLVLKERVADLARAVLSAYAAKALAGGDVQGGTARLRLPQGVQPPELVPLWQEILTLAAKAEGRIGEFVQWMKKRRTEEPGEASSINGHLVELGPPTKRLTDLRETAELMLDEAGTPPAKWFEFTADQGNVRADAKACPIFAGGLLQRQLWSRLRAAVVTSATLRSLGRFDFFLRESGLASLPGARSAAVASPFDYASQGRFVVVATEASPKNPAEHNRECARLIAQDLAQVERGALVLCSSWAQLRAIVEAQPAAVTSDLLVQGSAPRDELLKRHRAAVKAGRRSVLVGLQSFGEGLDLPGELCEWVLMPKVPFSSPSDPVSEARTEWLEAKGRNSFLEVVVPATGVTLNQWAGRGIRSERDRATIVCYDPRLATTTFGRQLLGGLPAFSKLHRKGGREQPLEL